MIYIKAWDENSKIMLEDFITLNQKEIEVDQTQVADIENIKLVYLFPTGAKDINKKDIYKGDICKDDAGTILEIVWQEDKYQFGAKVLEGCTLAKGLTFPLWQWNGCKENGYRRLEIIGNIYENADMIKKEK